MRPRQGSRFLQESFGTVDRLRRVVLQSTAGAPSVAAPAVGRVLGGPPRASIRSVSPLAAERECRHVRKVLGARSFRF